MEDSPVEGHLILPNRGRPFDSLQFDLAKVRKRNGVAPACY